MSFDVLLDENGDLPRSARIVDDARITMQRIRIRLRLFLGDWLLNKDEGLPYVQWAQMKPAPVRTIGARVRSEIETTPGVLRVERFEATFTPADRRLLITCRVILPGEAVDVAITAPSPSTGNRTVLIHMTRSGSVVRGMVG